jgi:hypothetical protein
MSNMSITRSENSRKYEPDIINRSDAMLMYQLAKTGVAIDNQVKAYLKMSEDRLDNLEYREYIATKNLTVNGCNRRVIFLGKKGRLFCEEQYGIRYFYSTQTNHLHHDIRLTEVFYKMPDKIKWTWKSEAELMDEIRAYYPEEEINYDTCIDARVVIENRYIGIEAVGSSYTSIICRKKTCVS